MKPFQSHHFATKTRQRVWLGIVIPLGLFLVILQISTTGAGAATVKCEGHTATIVGTPSPDGSWVTINGTDGRDVIVGTPGRDIIRGYGGDDLICGLTGRDRIFGGDGSDNLYGHGGNDSLNGGNGNDFLYGGGGNDVLRGYDGSDWLVGGRKNDRLEGGNGDDYHFGGVGVDSYVPGSGARDRCEDSDQTLAPDTCDRVTGQGDLVSYTPISCTSNLGTIFARITNDNSSSRTYSLNVSSNNSTTRVLPNPNSGVIGNASTGALFLTQMFDGDYSISVTRLEPDSPGQPSGRITTLDSRNIYVRCGSAQPSIAVASAPNIAGAEPWQVADFILPFDLDCGAEAEYVPWAELPFADSEFHELAPAGAGVAWLLGGDICGVRRAEYKRPPGPPNPATLEAAYSVGLLHCLTVNQDYFGRPDRPWTFVQVQLKAAEFCEGRGWSYVRMT